MNIVIEVSKHIDWEPVPDGTAEPTQADIAGLLVKKHGDKWHMRVTKDRATETTISIPDERIADLDNSRDHGMKTRAQRAAFLLQSHIMPFHAEQDHFVKIHVHDEPEVEKFLNSYFGCGGHDAKHS